MSENELRGRELFFLEKINSGEFVPTDKLGEVPEELRRRVLEDMRREDRQFFENFPAEEFSRKITGPLGTAEDEDRRKGTVREFTLRRFAPLLAAAMLAAAAGFFGFFPNLTGQEPMDQVRIKGMEPTLNIYRAERGAAEMLEPKAYAEQYDLLQLEYNAVGFPYGMIFSLDGRGTVTLHYPATREMDPKLESGAVLLPYSYQLDDAPDFERFFFVVSQGDFDSARVLGAAEELSAAPDRGRTGKLRLPEEFSQASVTILKEDR